MNELAFIAKFLGVTVLYFVCMALGVFGLKRFEPEPYSPQQTIASILGTHIGRLRFLVVAGTVSLVLAMMYPGPALLLPAGTGETLREFGHHLWYGNSRPFVPSPPDQSTWFWGQAGVLYVGAFVLYIVLALPNLLSGAVKAGQAVLNRADSTQTSGHGYWAAAMAFAAVIVGYVLGRRKAGS